MAETDQSQHLHTVIPAGHADLLESKTLAHVVTIGSEPNFDFIDAMAQ